MAREGWQGVMCLLEPSRHKWPWITSLHRPHSSRSLSQASMCGWTKWHRSTACSTVHVESNPLKNPQQFLEQAGSLSNADLTARNAAGTH
jgi:hypothetical protein